MRDKDMRGKDNLPNKEISTTETMGNEINELGVDPALLRQLLRALLVGTERYEAAEKLKDSSPLGENNDDLATE